MVSALGGLLPPHSPTQAGTLPGAHSVPSNGGPFLVLQKYGLSGWLHHSCLHGSKVLNCVRQGNEVGSDREKGRHGGCWDRRRYEVARTSYTLKIHSTLNANGSWASSVPAPL